MTDDARAPAGTTRRDGFSIFAAACALVALVFAVANFFVVSDARDTAESAKATAERALAGAGRATAPTAAPTTASPGTVGVTLDEYSIALSPSSPTAGKVSFDVTNAGKIKHEFVMFGTDLPADALPLDKSGDVNEDSPQLHNVADSGRDLKSGASRTVRAALSPGHYVAVCNLPDHYAAGMRVDVTVP